MNDYGYSQEHQPLTWWKGYAIYAAHVIVLVWVASMLVTTVLLRTAPGFLATLPFSSERVWAGDFWRIFTYGFYNPPSLWFVVEMAMIIWFGREVERFFGRRSFLQFYLGLYLFVPVLMTGLGFWRPLSLAGDSGAFGLFLAFAALHPNVALFFNVLAKYVAFVLVGIYTLIAFSQNDVSTLISLWATVGFAVAFVRYQQGRLTLPRWRWPTRQPKFRVIQGAAKTSNSPGQDAAMAEVDALLDKIARSGLGSLTADERARLDRGREAIRRRSSGR